MTRTLMRMDPWQQLARIEEELDELFHRGGVERHGPATFLPPVDAYETDDAIVYTLDLPGMTAEDVHIALHDHELTVAGERTTKTEEKHDGWLTRERRRGSFYRTFAVEPGIDEHDVHAEFSNGVLSIRVPRPAAQEPKPVEIAVKES